VVAAILGFSVINYGHPILAPFKVPNTEVTLSLREESAPLFIAFARWFHTEIEPLRKGECWGHAYRPVRGATNPSRHAAGIAIDLNAPRHPLGRRGTFSATEAAKIRAKAKSLGMRWGGDYTKRADEMHFELTINRTAALDLVRRLQAPARPKPTPNRWNYWNSYSKPGERTINRWDRGEDVKFLQRFLGLSDDGHFGPATETKVKLYQQMRRLQVDGTVGPATWREIGTGTKLR
jgi:peptidoglycan hydrolase-like protein with peptidoglycan-binding domain